MKKLGISLVAILVGLPTMVRADNISQITLLGNPAGTVATNTNVATTSYVQGAYNDLAGHINTNVTAINTLNGSDSTTGSVAKTVKDNAGAATYDNTDSGLTATTIQGAIDEVAAGAAEGAAALQASDLDGTTIEQDSTTNKVQVVAGSIGTTQLSSGVVTSLGLADTALQSNSALNGANLTAGTVAESALDSSVQAKLTAADSALQASDLDGTTIEQDGTTNKVQVVAGSIGTTQLSSGVVTSLGLADTALQAADLAGYGFNVYGSWATPSDSTGSVTVTNSNLTANN